MTAKEGARKHIESAIERLERGEFKWPEGRRPTLGYFLEAEGISRRTFYNHPDLRGKFSRLVRRGSKSKAQATIEQLRAENRELKTHLELALSEMAAMHLHFTQLYNEGKVSELKLRSSPKSKR